AVKDECDELHGGAGGVAGRGDGLDVWAEGGGGAGVGESQVDDGRGAGLIDANLVELERVEASVGGAALDEQAGDALVAGEAGGEEAGERDADLVPGAVERGVVGEIDGRAFGSVGGDEHEAEGGAVGAI